MIRIVYTLIHNFVVKVSTRQYANVTTSHEYIKHHMVIIFIKTQKT